MHAAPARPSARPGLLARRGRGRRYLNRGGGGPPAALPARHRSFEAPAPPSPLSHRQSGGATYDGERSERRAAGRVSHGATVLEVGCAAVGECESLPDKCAVSRALAIGEIRCSGTGSGSVPSAVTRRRGADRAWIPPCRAVAPEVPGC